MVGYTREDFTTRARSGNPFIRRVLAEPKEWVRGSQEVLVQTEAA